MPRFMISTKKAVNASELIKILLKHQVFMKKRYWGYNLQINRNLIWATVHIKEYSYQDVKQYIVKIAGHLGLRIKRAPNNKLNPDCIKYIQLQAFHSSPHRVNELYDWIIKHNYNAQPPILRRTTDHKKYHIRWSIPNNLKHSDIINHWKSQHQHVNIYKCFTKNWISNLKNNAIIALNQLYRHAISKLHSDHSKIKKHSRFIAHSLIRDSVPSISNISALIQKYPFLQPFAPNTNPMVTSIIKIKKIKIAFMNINGGYNSTRNKINHNHPYMQQLMNKHNPDILIFIDTHIRNPPNWKLNGFKLIVHKTIINLSYRPFLFRHKWKNLKSNPSKKYSKLKLFFSLFNNCVG